LASRILTGLTDESTDFASTRVPPINDQRPLLARWFDPGKYPLQQRIEDKRRGIGRQKYPVVGQWNCTFMLKDDDFVLVWALTITMVAVFIYELVVNARAQGTPLSFHVGQLPHAHVRCANLSVALCQSDAGTIWKCIDPGRRSLSTMHEDCSFRSCHTANAV
jgi:hypothetical protein